MKTRWWKRFRNIALPALRWSVFEKEPLPENHPFWSMENVIISPHSASFTPDSWKRVLELLKNNFIAFSKGEKLTNEINKAKGY